MRKYIILLCIPFLVIACKKSDDLPPNNVNVGLVGEVLSLQTNRTAIVAFQMLTSEEKAFFWKTKLQKILDLNEFTSDQRNHIQLLINFVKPSLYNKSDNLAQTQLKEFGRSWTKTGLQLFPPEQLYKIAYQLSKYDISNSTDEIQPPPQSDCTCCSSCLSQCFFGMQGNCDTRWKCRKLDSGCGIVGGSGCDGKCGTFPIDQG